MARGHSFLMATAALALSALPLMATPSQGADARGGAGRRGPDSIAVALSAGRVVLRELRFATNSDRLTPAGASIVRRLAKAINGMSGVFLIEGHVDGAGDPTREQALSMQRATAVKTQLALEGVPPARLVAVGYGATRPSPTPPSGSSARIEVARTQ